MINILITFLNFILLYLRFSDVFTVEKKRKNGITQKKKSIIMH